MNKLSMIQQYYILAVNENGELGNIYREEGKAGFVFAGIYDLLDNDIIELSHNVLRVQKELPKDFQYLSSLYDLINTKSFTIKKLLNHYIAYAKVGVLIDDVCIPLLNNNNVIKSKGGMLGHKDIYIPCKDIKNQLVQQIKENKMSPLVYLLVLTKHIKEYFEESEIMVLKKDFKGMKDYEMLENINEVKSYLIWETLLLVVFMIFLVWLL